MTFAQDNVGNVESVYIIDNYEGDFAATNITPVASNFIFPAGDVGATVPPGDNPSMVIRFDTTSPAPFPGATQPIFSYKYGFPAQTVFAYSSTPNVTVYSGQVNFPTQGTAVTYSVNNLTVFGGNLVAKPGVTIAAGGALALTAGSGVIFNPSAANVGSFTPFISTASLSAPTTAGANVSVVISEQGALATGTYDLIGYGSAPGNANPAANFQLSTIPPSGQNWGFINGNNQLDLVVASTATVQNTAAWSSTDPTQFGAAANWLIGSGSSYVGLQSAAISVDGTSPVTGGPLLSAPGGSPLTATILAGTNSGGFTRGDSANVTMAWRTTTPQETGLYNGGTPTSPPLPRTYSPLISNVIQILGMSNGPTEPAPRPDPVLYSCK